MSDIFETLMLLLSSKQSSHSNTQIALEFAKVNENGRALDYLQGYDSRKRALIGIQITLVLIVISLCLLVLPREDMNAVWGTCKRQVFS